MICTGHEAGRMDGHFITIKTKSEVKVKVTVTRKWYGTLRHPKMHPHTKFGIPTSKNIGDMHRTGNGTEGRTDSAITICLPKFLWGHKKSAVGRICKSRFPMGEYSFRNDLS